VHDWRIRLSGRRSFGLGCLRGRGDVELDLLSGVRRRGGGGDNCEGRFQADGGGGFGVGQDIVDEPEREIDALLGFFAEVEYPFILGMCQGFWNGGELRRQLLMVLRCTPACSAAAMAVAPPDRAQMTASC
jgi:hypothetical protein